MDSPTSIGRYRVLGRLGHGGMAVVYLAQGVGPAGFRRLFAIKTIHPHFTGEREFVDMFLDEARLAARIHHANAVPVYEVGTDDGVHYIAMDYVNGETLSRTLQQANDQGPPFPLPLAIHILEGVCEALHTAHELTDRHGRPLNVVHRDVSPQNILVGYDGIPRITDFGVAKAANRLTRTDAGSPKGKAAYMAPEQVLSGDLDRRVDVFALGTVLWEALAGRRLFKEESLLATMDRVVEGALLDVRQFRPEMPAALARVVERALAKDRDQRFETARALAQALRSVAVEYELLAATPDLEQYMRSTFPESYARRLEIVRNASVDDALDETDAMEVEPFADTLAQEPLDLDAVELGERDEDEEEDNADDRVEFRPRVAAREHPAHELMDLLGDRASRMLRSSGTFAREHGAGIVRFWSRLRASAVRRLRTDGSSEHGRVRPFRFPDVLDRFGMSPLRFGGLLLLGIAGGLTAAMLMRGRVEESAGASLPAMPAMPYNAATNRTPLHKARLDAPVIRAGPTVSTDDDSNEKPPPHVHLVFDVHPAGAKVRVNEEIIAGGLSLPFSTEPLTVEVEARGYLSTKRTIIPDRDQRLEIRLKKRVRRSPKERKPQPAKRRLLIGGDDL